MVFSSSIIEMQVIISTVHLMKISQGFHETLRTIIFKESALTQSRDLAFAQDSQVSLN